ncbi:tetraspanin-14-like [Ornithodoros turicata]|uniref:tetraspanin-14-like n=1 Tax=Ornithodoros turicata TaxID=34597 RepID=UPI003139E0FC
METTKTKSKRKQRKTSTSSRRGHDADTRKAADATSAGSGPSCTSGPMSAASHETVPFLDPDKADGVEVTTHHGTCTSPMKTSTRKDKTGELKPGPEPSLKKHRRKRRGTLSDKPPEETEHVYASSRKESCSTLPPPPQKESPKASEPHLPEAITSEHTTSIIPELVGTSVHQAHSSPDLLPSPPKASPKASQSHLLEDNAEGNVTSVPSALGTEASGKDPVLETEQPPKNHDVAAGLESDTAPQREPSQDRTTAEGKDLLSTGVKEISPGPLRKNVAVSTEMHVSETTVELDVNPYVRYPLVSLNICFWLFGFLLIMAGLYAYIDTWNQSQYSSFSSSNNIYSVIMVRVEITVMLLGAALLSLSFCGCVGALRENTCLLNTYSYFITALLLINLVMGLLVFFLPTQFKRLLRSTLTQNLVLHYRDNPDFQQLIDTIQEYLRCCGISERAFRDWDDNIYFNCSRSNPSYERCSVPYSCCKRNETDSVVSLYCGHGVLNMTDYDAWFKVNTGNCLDAAHRYIRENVTLITGLCLVIVIMLAFVQMVTQALIDEILIIRKIYDKFYDRVHDIRAAEFSE